MVFTIGDDDDGASDMVGLCETVHCQLYGMADICTLSSNERRIDVLQEHLRRDVVSGNRQLYESITSKDHKSYFIVGEVVNHVFDEHLALFQSARHNILSEHGIGDVHTDDGFDALTIVV